VKIYTRTGDAGETALFGGGRVRKDVPRIEAVGEVDELNAAIGWAVVALEDGDAPALVDDLRRVQADLFAIGAHLATPGGTENAAARHLPPIPSARPEEMEGWIDVAENELAPLRNFILPGGTEAAARLHLARAVCRRAERRILALQSQEGLDGTIIVYLNRLSDLLFTLARLANARAAREDVEWRGR
jgi:cob(I)alamin adenosyltransferase